MEAFMKTSIVCCAVVAICSLSVLAPDLSAHHAFAAEFDSEKCQDFTGILTRLDWQSPHAFFYVDIEDDAGEVENWSFQTYALITLRRNGTGRQLFIENIGKEVRVRGCLAKNGRELYAAAGLLRFSDDVLHQVGQIQN
jgi:hypothetical protein